MKLISREVDGEAKINIYDPYVDKYYVIENESELDKLVSDDGKLIPDEQVRQYFYQKSARDKLSKRNKNGIQVRKGFTTKTANLKKEYADVQKSTFKDYIKSKIYDVYGLYLSDEDIISFNKNPTLSTIKSFKSVNDPIKKHMLNIYKVNEAHFNKDYEDQNNFSSLLEVLLKNKPEASQNQHTQNLLALEMVKSDIEAIGNTEDNREIQQHLQNIKNTATIVPIINTILPNNLTVENAKTYLEDFNNAIDNLIKDEKREEENFKYDKSLFPVNQVVWKPGTEDKNHSYHMFQFTDAKTIKNFNMEPVQTLKKNLDFIQFEKNNLLKNNYKINLKEGENSDKIQIKFGNYQFDYEIDKNTPYYTNVKKYLENIMENKADADVDLDSVNAEDYQDVKPKVVNKVTFSNPYEGFENLDEIDKNSFEWKFASLIETPKINVKDFNQYLNSIKDKEWRKNMTPKLHFAQEDWSKHNNNPFTLSLKAPLPFYKNDTMAILKNIDEKVDPIYEIHNSSNKNKWTKEDKKRLKTFMKANVLNNLVQFSQNPKELAYPFLNVQDDYFDYFKETDFADKYKNLINKLYTKKGHHDYDVKEDMDTFTNSITEEDLEAINQNSLAIQDELQKNLDDAYYFYYPLIKDRTSAKLTSLEEGNNLKRLDVSDPHRINGYIQQDLFNPYYYSLVNPNVLTEEFVIERKNRENNIKKYKIKKEKKAKKDNKMEHKSDGLGMIRDMIAFKLNK